MSKHILPIILLLCFSQVSFSQEDSIALNKISDYICTSLNNIEPNPAVVDSINLMIDEQIEQYSDVWLKYMPTEELPAIKKITQKYRSLLTHRLLLDCPSYRYVDFLMEPTNVLTSKEALYLVEPTNVLTNQGALYLNAKDFLLAIETNADNDSLMTYFAPGIDDLILINSFNKLKKELIKYSRISGFYITPTNHQSTFHIDLYDIKEGNSNCYIILYFKDYTDTLFDEIAFFTKEEIIKKKEKEEKIRKTNPPSIPPPPPPPPGIKGG